jgi:hypothetical protein
MRRISRLGCALLLLCGASALAAPAERPFRYPEQRHGKGELKYIDGVPVLIVQGTPEEMGAQMAALGCDPAPRVQRYPADIANRLPLLVRKRAWRYLVRSGEELLGNFPGDHRREFDAMVKAGLDRELLLTANTMFDLRGDDRPATEKLFPRLHQFLFGCSSVVIQPERSATKGPLFGRNLDYPSLGYLNEYSLVVVCRPAGKRAFAAVGFPGLIGCLSGINDAGLSLATHEVHVVNDKTVPFKADGVPYALCYRRVLEECATVAEAKKLLQSMKRTTTTNLVVCDRNGGVVLEISPEAVEERALRKGIGVCTNHYLAEKLRPAEQPDKYQTLTRYKTLEAIGEMPERRLSVADVQKALDEANLGEQTLQTMVFEPATLKLHVAFGSCPTTQHPLRALNLEPLLKPAAKDR